MKPASYIVRFAERIRTQGGFFVRMVRRRARAINNRRRSLVSVEIHGGIPNLVLHEKYERKVKFVLRLLMGVGILVSVLTIPVWYLSLAVALLLVGIELFLESTVFEYTSIYVMPMPTFTYDPEQWVGMGYAFAQDTGDLDLVGPAFKDHSYAMEFLMLLRRWNYEENDDNANNIHLSFILEKESQYAAYLYPDLRRQSASKFFDEIEEKSYKEKPGKRHQQLVVLFTFCKLFPFSSSSNLNVFHSRHNGKGPFLLTTFVQQGTRYEPLLDPEPIIKLEYKYKRRADLEPGENEYSHGKSTMGL